MEAPRHGSARLLTRTVRTTVPLGVRPRSGHSPATASSDDTGSTSLISATKPPYARLIRLSNAGSSRGEIVGFVGIGVEIVETERIGIDEMVQLQATLDVGTFGPVVWIARLIDEHRPFGKSAAE